MSRISSMILVQAAFVIFILSVLSKADISRKGLATKNESIELFDEDCGDGLYEGENGICEQCKGYAYYCLKDKECCGKPLLECDRRFCECQEGYLWNSWQDECQPRPTLPSNAIEDAVDDWILPVAISAGIVLLIGVIVAVAFFIRRRNRKLNSAGGAVVRAPIPAYSPSAPPADVWGNSPAGYPALNSQLSAPSVINEHSPGAIQQPQSFSSLPPSYYDAVQKALRE